MAELLFASLMSENARTFCQQLTDYLSLAIEAPMRLLDDPWPATEAKLYRGEAQLGIVCGLQYVLAVDRGESPGVELLAAPVMAAPRYEERPVYFSDDVVRADNPHARSPTAGSTWAYNERTSHSGYAVTRCALAERGEAGAFFGRLMLESGAHLQSLAWLLDGHRRILH